MFVQVFVVEGSFFARQNGEDRSRRSNDSFLGQFGVGELYNKSALVDF